MFSLAQMRRALVLALTLAVSLQAQEDGDSAPAPEESAPVVAELDAEEGVTVAYVAPTTDGLHWSDAFDGDALGRWVQAGGEKYNGRFEASTRKTESLIGDVGLLVPKEAMHYGASASFAPVKGDKEAPLVIQYEVAFQDGLQCGGSYIKLFDREGKQASEFDADTPYIIMFGPDRCGSTDKVHFILRHKNPKTGSWEEKHMKDTPSVPQGTATHLYGLQINADNSFVVKIDGVVKTSGNLLESMNPPINPPKDIDDPTDSKPADWVDAVKIDDPESAKPEEWDEDEPMMIADPEASMPDGWNEDAKKQIADPAAVIPADWDVEEDGEWEAPVIANPECKVGCGKWTADQISNPKYKGKWHAPQIDNPAYKGEWKPKQIPNPDHFMDETPALLPEINAVGIDIWTMQGGILFDNFAVSHSVEAAEQFADTSFKLRNEVELKQQEAQRQSKKGMMGGIVDFVQQNVIAVVVTLVVLLIATIWFCCLRGESEVPPAAAASERRKAAAKSTAATKEKKDENGEKEAKDDETEEAAKETKTKGKGKGKGKKDAKDENKEAGGLGDVSKDE